MANKAVKTYVCKTCGATSAERGHLCAPREASSVIICECCGTQSDPRHICRPKLAKIQYQCEQCRKGFGETFNPH